MLKKYQWDNKEFYPIISKYAVNGTLAVSLWYRPRKDSKHLRCWAVISTCLYPESDKLSEDEAYIDTNNCGWAIKFIEKYKLGVYLHHKARSGFCEYPLYSFDLTKLNGEETMDVTLR